MALLGCIADDFTGAADAASFLAEGGLPVQLFSGVPPVGISPGEGTQALVIALKTRTMQTGQAVRESLDAMNWLESQGVTQFYLKYCSTFDSSPAGNIGPVADAALELIGARYTVLCPSLPVNGRTVSAGHLYVNGIPLHKSSMKDHPLTPMWDSFIPSLMEPQSRYGCMLLDRSCLSYSREAVEAQLFQNADFRNPEHFYVIPDYSTEQDGQQIAALFGHLPLLTGGSGLLYALARRRSESEGSSAQLPPSRAAGPALLIAGSCSQATLAQISYFQSKGGVSKKLTPSLVLGRTAEEAAQELWPFIQEHSRQPVLIYSSDTPEQVKENQNLALGAGQPLSVLLEETAAALARRAVENGWRRLIIAGGETSGAVTRGLGLNSYLIGESVAPGVPIMIPPQRPELRVVLKSGNFGQKDFFFRALSMTEEV